MRCGHERTVGMALDISTGQWMHGGDDGRVCLDCDEWMSLGPAMDTADTAIEVRAAEIAHGENRFAWLTEDEMYGWLTRDEVSKPRTAGELAGWLAAHHIANGEE